jgi:uncharacterized protein YacL
MKRIINQITEMMLVFMIIVAIGAVLGYILGAMVSTFAVVNVSYFAWMGVIITAIYALTDS